MSLLRMSLTGGALILAVALLRGLLLHRVPRSVFPILWWVVLARLLIPFSLPVRTRAAALLRAAAPAVSASPAAPTVGSAPLPAALPALPQGSAAALPQVSTTAAAGGGFPWAAVWAVGTALLALFFLAVYFRALGRFRAAEPAAHPLAEEWLRAHPLRRPLSIRQSPRAAVPLTYGLLRPVILLPDRADWADARTMTCVLTHEYTHIRRFDNAAKLLLAAALCLHWWNPAVWLLYVLANRDLELACDEAVVRRAGADARGAYARMLLALETRKDGAPLQSHFNQNALEERIVSIMKLKKITVLSLVLAAVLIAGTVAACAASAVTPQPAAEPIQMPEPEPAPEPEPEPVETLLPDPEPAAPAEAPEEALQVLPDPIEIPLWMQPYTQILYDDNLQYTILQGGELTEADLEGRDDIDASDLGSTMIDDEYSIRPGCKVEYDLHGYIQNIYYPVPGHSGEFQLSDPDWFIRRPGVPQAAADAFYRLIAFRVDGFDAMTVADFNAMLVPDEDALGPLLEDYATVNAAFSRDELAMADFLNVTLNASLGEEYGKVFDEDVPLFEAVQVRRQPYPEPVDGQPVYAFYFGCDYHLEYTMPDPAAITVAERDSALRTFAYEFENHVYDLSEAELSDPDIREALTAYADDLAAQHSGPGIQLRFDLQQVELNADAQ